MTKQLPLVDADKYPCGGEMQECKKGIQFHVCADCAKEAQRDADQQVYNTSIGALEEELSVAKGERDYYRKQTIEQDRRIAALQQGVERLKKMHTIDSEYQSKLEAQLVNMPTPEEAKAVSIGRIRTKQTFEDWGELYDSCIIKLKAIVGETK